MSAVAARAETAVPIDRLLKAWRGEIEADAATRLLTGIAKGPVIKDQSPASRYSAEATSNGPSSTRACLPTAQPMDL